MWIQKHIFRWSGLGMLHISSCMFFFFVHTATLDPGLREIRKRSWFDSIFIFFSECCFSFSVWFSYTFRLKNSTRHYRWGLTLYLCLRMDFNAAYTPIIKYSFKHMLSSKSGHSLQNWRCWYVSIYILAMLDFRQSLFEIIHLSQNKAHVFFWSANKMYKKLWSASCFTFFVSRLHHM